MKNLTYRIFPIVLLLSLLVTSCTKKVYQVNKESGHYYKLQKNKPKTIDADVESIISPYRTTMKKEMDEIVVYSLVELIKDKPNSTMGNWIADIVLEETQKLSDVELDGAFQNYGGLRIKSMPIGAVTKGKIFEVMPFENMTVILHLPGSVLRQLCDRITAYGGWPTSKGIQFKMGRDRKAENILIKGEPLDETKTYHIALADYVANGGDSCGFLKGADRTETGVLIRDLILSHLDKMNKAGEKINTAYEERILHYDGD